MSWSRKYLRIPEAELHCWGLVCKVYVAELGLALPSYQGAMAGPIEQAEIEALIAREERSPIWRAVTGDEARQPFDVLVFRRGGIRSHVGLVVDWRFMLHTEGHSRLERLAAPSWQTRLAGVYRHVECPVEGGVK